MNRTGIESATHTWKPVLGFEGYYASQGGRILGPSGRIMRSMKMSTGHLYVFCNRGRAGQRKLFIHRAVLLAFVGLPTLKQVARHLNGNPANNSLENLVWGTKLENTEDRRVHGTMPIPHEAKDTKLVPSDIPTIFLFHKEGKSSRRIGKWFNTSHTTIQKILRGERWKGYCRE